MTTPAGFAKLLLCGLCLLVLSPTLAAREHRVFAHFMVCLPLNGDDSVASYKHQILLAQQYGIDGFALNCGSWDKDPYYIRRSLAIYQAAKELGTGFQLFFSIDTATGLDPLPVALDMMQRFADHPNQFRCDGKPVLSAYSGPKPRWAETLAALKAAGHEVCFVPFFWTANYTLAPSYDGVLNTFTDAPYLDGYFLFGIDAPAWDLIQGNRNCRRATAKLGKVYMATNSFAYNSANVRDFRGLRGYADIWQALIADHADWVELVTWNDYTEDGHLSPAYAGAGGGQPETGRVDHDESYLDATAYYASWFKHGQPPAIAQEKLFVTYRERSKWQNTGYDEKKQAWANLPDQIHDDVEDNVYATAFLQQPAELTIESGAAQQIFTLAAGVQHVQLPFQPGVPRFILRRAGQVIAQFSGRQEIIKTPTPENSPLVWRNSNRTWSSTWCVGEGQTFQAAQAPLSGGAEVVQADGQAAVHLPPTPGAGLKLSLAKLPPGPLNVRIRYRNAGATVARLTVAVAGGAPFALFPAFLPPTDPHGWATNAFLWTPPQPATDLSLEFRVGDTGEPLIASVELVPAKPVVAADPAAAAPALVALPGGTFTMGDAHGEPDEAPVHEVTVSPFRLARCAITNSEYEQFEPEHRRYRDSYSWRDDDPVIYVSWQKAALYCNWRSAQEQLKPAYDAKTWAVDLRAGYRLPTEAEWEYAASGRGENRRYPWGNEPPDATRCNAGGTGTVAVGSYPAGASRDGILGLAGNVAQWCSDQLHPYAAAALTDPCPQEPSPYRVIRGGSWGYYNRSQRVHDREFNSQVYPGYYYIGFRVALPQAPAPPAP